MTAHGLTLTRCPAAAPVSALAALAVHRQRMCGVDLRGRLAPGSCSACHRLDRRFRGSAAGDYLMGGMCMGSLLLPPSSRAGGTPAGLRPARAGHRLDRSRGVVRHAVCRTGLSRLRRWPRPVGHSLRGAVAGVCLLLPTLLMGPRTLAVEIARWVETGPEGSWLGFFYSDAGAVFGCLLAGFYCCRLRHGHGDLRRVRPHRDRGRERPGSGGRPGLVTKCWPTSRRRGTRGPLPEPGQCIWQSPSLIPLPLPRWSGHVCSRWCSAAPCAPFPLILAVFLIGLGVGGAASGPVLGAPPRRARVAALAPASGS